MDHGSCMQRAAVGRPVSQSYEAQGGSRAGQREPERQDTFQFNHPLDTYCIPQLTLTATATGTSNETTVKHKG